jgi:hypothetical protein
MYIKILTDVKENTLVINAEAERAHHGRCKVQVCSGHTMCSPFTTGTVPVLSLTVFQQHPASYLSIWEHYGDLEGTTMSYTDDKGTGNRREGANVNCVIWTQ